MKSRRKSVSALVAAAIAMTSLVLAQPAQAAAPTLLSVVKDGSTTSAGSVSGGFDVEITGTGFCNGSTNLVQRADIGAIQLGSLNVDCAAGTVVGSVPVISDLEDRVAGPLAVTVTTDVTSSTELFFFMSPEIASVTDYNTVEIIDLGDLFSRTQRQPIVRSRTQPYTVSGNDFLTGEPYSYTTNWDYLASSDPEDQAAYALEPDMGHPQHPGAVEDIVLNTGEAQFGYDELEVTRDVSGASLSPALASLASDGIDTSQASGLTPSQWLDGREAVELYSALNCGYNDDRDNTFDGKTSYCAGFGPDIFSEPFVGSDGISLGFDWAAIGIEDDYAVYAFLVSVDPVTGAIPVQATAENHKLVMYNSGSRRGFSDWNTASAPITEDGTYRFRFINGSYDGTGGFWLGSLFYVSEIYLAGLTNTISFGPFDDEVVGPGDNFVIDASSTAGGEVTVVSLSPSVCTIASLSTDPPTYTVTVGTTDSTCILQASQGAVGQYAPAASVISAIEFRDEPTTPDAPTLVSVTPGNGQLTADWNSGPNGGSPIENYEYSTDNGVTWVSITPAITMTDYTITGLENGTTYDVKVRAVNDVGPGLASNMLQGMPDASLINPVVDDDNAGVPVPYSGPIVQPVDPQVPKAPAGTARFTGSKLDEITKVVIDGTTVPFKMVGSQLELTLPPGIKPGFYDVQVSGGFGVLNVLRAVNVLGVTQTPDIGKKMWTNINAEKTSVRVIYKNPVGVGKVQFTLNGVEIAWVRAVDDTDPKLRKYTLEGIEIPYLVRNVVLTPGIKNAFEIYVDGVRVWRAAYYSGN